MARRLVYFYLMRPFPKQIQKVVPTHVDYWKRAGLDDYRGGPFADGSGGLIEFVCSDIQKAKEMITKDPFVLEGLIETTWLKEWMIE